MKQNGHFWCRSARGTRNSRQPISDESLPSIPWRSAGCPGGALRKSKASVVEMGVLRPQHGGSGTGWSAGGAVQ